MSFGLCRSNRVKYQVQPISPSGNIIRVESDDKSKSNIINVSRSISSNKTGKNELDENISPAIKAKPRLSFGLQRSSKRLLESTAESSIDDVKREIFMTVSGIFWKEQTYQEYEYQLLNANCLNGLHVYEYKPNDQPALCGLVRLLREALVSQKNFRYFTISGAQYREILPKALDTLTILVDEYKEYPEGIDQLSTTGYNCFTTVEFALICTVSFIGAFYYHSLNFLF